MSPWFWLCLGVVLLALETLNGTFLLAMLGGAAVATAGIALAVPIPLLTLTAFAALSVLGLVLLRPLLLVRLRARGPGAPTNVAALAGQSARLVRAFDATGYGRVRVGGEEWRAHLAEGWPLSDWREGTMFTVLRADGVTLEVCPEDLGASVPAAPGRG